jgi:hypothetical protein
MHVLVVGTLVAEAAEMVIQALLGIAQCALVASPAFDYYYVFGRETSILANPCLLSDL